jgi:hypothetical protein
MLAVVSALVVEELRLVQKQGDASASFGEGKLHGGEQLTREVLLALGAERDRQRDFFPAHRQTARSGGRQGTPGWTCPAASLKQALPTASRSLSAW